MSDYEKIGDYSLNLKQVITKSKELDIVKNPDLQGIQECVLKDGPQAYKVATYWTIRNRHSGQPHHQSLKLETFKRTKARGWERKPENSISLDNENDDEVQKLFDFLATLTHIKSEGDYAVIRDDDNRISKVIDAIATTEQRRELIDQILSWINAEPMATDDLIEFSAESPERSKALLAALNYGHYSRVLTEFKQLISENQQERVYQGFLEKNLWIFGSEYSELISGREIIANTQLDFPLRRTVDDYLEVIEIKRPFSDPLFVNERLAPRSELSDAVAQAEGYLSLLDQESDRIWRAYGIRADKVRAIVVIGRSGDAKQLEALRRHNANRNKVEVLTFDQLLSIGQRILDIITSNNPRLNTHSRPSVSEDDIPF